MFILVFSFELEKKNKFQSDFTHYKNLSQLHTRRQEQNKRKWKILNQKYYSQGMKTNGEKFLRLKNGFFFIFVMVKRIL